MKIMKNLQINLKKEVDDSYEIEFVENTWKALSDFLISKKYSKILVVSDSNVYPLHCDNLLSSINSSVQVETLKLPAWEENKHMNWVLEICQKLIDIKANRNDCIVALWWGVMWDMVWFAGSIFKRGINVVQIPTSLLSMFDSSVWWKTGVDFNDIKNIIWNFKQPERVFINSEYLETLPQEEILSWYFEWLKHSLLDSREYYEEFKIDWEIFGSSDTSGLNNIISRNVSVKAKIVMEDEHEMWVRKFLNYGHTFWHALESVTNFELPHGVCVWFGMMYVNILSHKLWYLSSIDKENINNFIKNKLWNNKKILLSKNINFENVYSKMTSDKKNVDANISFTLLDNPGELHIEKISGGQKSLLKDSFKDFLDICQ